MPIRWARSRARPPAGDGYGAAARLLPGRRPFKGTGEFLAPYAFLLMTNWINDLYQATPFDLTTLADAQS